MITDVTPLAAALALAFAHGSLAGIAPALAVEREGPVFKVGAHWGLLDGSVTVEARGATLDACHESLGRLVHSLWPELEDAAAWL
jgi:hypothetical protein